MEGWRGGKEEQATGTAGPAPTAVPSPRTGEAALVALAVSGDVHSVALLQLGDLVLDGLPASAGGARGIGGVVAVAAGAVPVARDGLGIKGDLHVVELSQAVHDVPRHPQVVAHLDAGAGAHLLVGARAARQAQQRESLGWAGKACRHVILRAGKTDCDANLVLPLRRHDLRVHAADVDTSVQARLEVALDQLAADCRAGTSCKGT